MNVKKWRHDKNRPDLGKKHKSLNHDAVKDFELRVPACFILTYFLENFKPERIWKMLTFLLY
jgi:hypothetical protein